MTMMPFVSILIPAYNAEKCIAYTLQSALAQTWAHREIIVVDDGSTDRTLEVARSFEPQGVKVVPQKNQGAAAARNLAYAHSRGDYIQWLDADDLLGAEKVATQIEALGTSPSKRLLLSSEWGLFYHRPEKASFLPSRLWCDLSPIDWLVRKMEGNSYMQTACWLVSRELCEAAGPWDARLSADDDGEYFCRVVLASQEVRFVPQSRVYYRLSGPASMSYIGSSSSKLESQWLSIQLNVGYIRSLEDSPRVHAACRKFIQNWMPYFYPERMDVYRDAGKLCEELGGELEVPHLSWKYSIIRTLFGARLTRTAQRSLPVLRWSWVRAWDRFLFRLTERKAGSPRLV
jgi:glycosyltransferase involved in cell wall biosynthesis